MCVSVFVYVKVILGNVDLLLKHESIPSLSDFDAASNNLGIVDEVILLSPETNPPLQSGRWYLTVLPDLRSVAEELDEFVFFVSPSFVECKYLPIFFQNSITLFPIIFEGFCLKKPIILEALPECVPEESGPRDFEF